MSKKYDKPFVAQCLFCLNGVCVCTGETCPTKGLESCVGTKNASK